MASTEEILKQASALGDLIAEHDASKSMESAVKALQNDPSSQQALADLNKHAAGLEAKAAQGKPIEVADKRKMEELQQAVVLNPLMANFQRSQMAYVDLLRKVDDAITGRPAEEAAAAAGPIPGAGPIVGPGM
ncbi:MAG: YlbF family regulator [Phycisphaerales bacterium JB063]